MTTAMRRGMRTSHYAVGHFSGIALSPSASAGRRFPLKQVESPLLTEGVNRISAPPSGLWA